MRVGRDFFPNPYYILSFSFPIPPSLWNNKSLRKAVAPWPRLEYRKGKWQLSISVSCQRMGIACNSLWQSWPGPLRFLLPLSLCRARSAPLFYPIRYQNLKIREKNLKLEKEKLLPVGSLIRTRLPSKRMPCEVSLMGFAPVHAVCFPLFKKFTLEGFHLPGRLPRGSCSSLKVSSVPAVPLLLKLRPRFSCSHDSFD